MKNRKQDTQKAPARQGSNTHTWEPNKIGANTPYNFRSRNLTAYGGLLPVATMLERLEFQQLIEETLTVNRLTRAMTMYQFVLAMVLSFYVGFSRLYHLRFLEREPMLTGILRVRHLPPQSTFWRFLASLGLPVGAQILKVQRRMRERVWEAANVKLKEVTSDTDTTVHTVWGTDGSAEGVQSEEQGEEKPPLTSGTMKALLYQRPSV